MNFKIILEKYAKNKVDSSIILKQVNNIGAVAERNRTIGFEFHKVKTPPEAVLVNKDGQDYLYYNCEIKVSKDNYRSEDTVLRQFDTIVTNMQNTAKAGKWLVRKEGDAPIQHPIFDTPAEKIKAVGTFDWSVPDLTTEVMGEHFGRVFEREPHIRTIYDSAMTARLTDFNKRYHVVLHGRAACAKTEVLMSFADWFGNDTVVKKLDATTTTKAGLERYFLDLAEAGELPLFVIIEEIEKCDPKNLPCLLGIMDQRGTIQRTNARTGDTSAEAKTIIWATCNNVKLLKSVMSGALWSRFNFKLHCSRPSRNLMEKILLREVEEMNGKKEWVPSVLNFVFDEMKSNDPREAIAMLAGRDRIMEVGPGSFLDDMRQIIAAEKQDKDVAALEAE